MLDFLFDIIIIIVIVILIKKGLFRKQAKCRNCNQSLKGTEQIPMGSGNERFVLCRDCFHKIHPELTEWAKGHWSYSEYQDYLNWEQETKEERRQFKPTNSYGYSNKLQIDTDRCLFSIGSANNPLILRFVDLADCDINFKTEQLKDGLFSTRVKGNEYIAVELVRPAVYLERILNFGVTYQARQKGFISTKYEYELSDEFTDIIRAFTICLYITENAQNSQSEQEEHNIDEIQKALALFMFDSMDDVTEANLKKQRNALIKAFHPDNNENNEEYSKKINAAYELLNGMIDK